VSNTFPVSCLVFYGLVTYLRGNKS
jgi:hypothetical protein